MSPQSPDTAEPDLRVTPPKTAAAGLPAVAVSLGMAVRQMGVGRTARSLLRLNQVDGFDCMSCAWPDPDPKHRHTAEFCENGAKAVAWEGDTRRIGRAFFAEHSLADLEGRSEYWMGEQGRLTEPMVRRAGGTHYEPIGWDGAFALVGEHLQALDSPDRGAVLHLRPRVERGRVRLPALRPRVRHEQPAGLLEHVPRVDVGRAAEAIGIGKGSVSLDDIHDADLIVISGQNPGTNHPRMLSALEIAKRNGARIIAINPLREAGLLRFDNPQKPAGLAGHGTELADHFLQIRSDGDLALWQALGHLLLRTRACADTAVHRRAHPRVRRLGRAPRGARPRRGARRHRPGLGRDRAHRRHAGVVRARSCTAGRWASPSTATPSRRSRSSSTSRCCRA